MVSPDMTVWTGRDDTRTEGPNALRWWQCVKPYSPNAEPGIVLIGFACDEGVRRNGGRVGAKDGPHALRKALGNLAWRSNHPVYDAGDIGCRGDDMETAQSELADSVSRILKADHRPIIIGGGHEAAWGTYQGMATARPDKTIGIVNLDSHFDLRSNDRPNSGTAFKQISDWCLANGKPFSYMPIGIASTANTTALFDRARSLGVNWINDRDVSLDTECIPTGKLGGTENDAINKLATDLLVLNQLHMLEQSVDGVHLSIDLDVLPAAIMPAVSSPAGIGVSLEMVRWLIFHAITTGIVIAVEIVELNPLFDIDGRGALTAACLLCDIVQMWSALSYGNPKSDYA